MENVRIGNGNPKRQKQVFIPEIIERAVRCRLRERELKIAQVKAQIVDGVFETSERIDGTVERLLPIIG